MYINEISVNGRYNHPTVLAKTALVTYFVNNGSYEDPESISAVSIFRSADNYYPSSVIATDGQISVSGLVLMNFANSSADTSNVCFDVSNYAIGSSGIFRVRDGVFAVVLDSSITESVFNLSGENTIANQVSATGDYIDVWTIRRAAGSNLDTVINDFTLHDDRFYTLTEPILFRVATKLENRYITLGSKVDLKFSNEFTIENANIDRSIINLFKESFILNPAIEIYKENSDRNLPSRVVVSSFADTSANCDITSDNTVIFTFDTGSIATHPQTLAGNLGSLTGSYVAKLKFSALNQIYYSNAFAFIVR
jgi:hypothetical protein